MRIGNFLLYTKLKSEIVHTFSTTGDDVDLWLNITLRKVGVHMKFWYYSINSTKIKSWYNFDSIGDSIYQVFWGEENLLQ